MTNIMTLEEACEVLTCGVASTPTYVDENIGIPFLSAQNVKDGLVVLDKYKYVSKDFHNHLTKKNKPRIKDILYSRVGSKFGEAAVVNFEFEFSVYVSLTLIRPKAFVDSYFLKYYLNSPIIKTLATKTIKSSGVPNLNVKDVRSFPISIPSLSEQQAIVEKLDFAFDAIEKAKANIEKNIENAKELFQSKLNEIFSQRGEGWEEKTLNEISKNLDSKRIPITKNVRTEGKIPYYGASGIVDYVEDFIFDGSYLLISEDGANLLARTYPIAFSVKGKFWVNNHAHILEFKDFVTQKFVEYYLNSIKLDNYVTGMAQPKLSQTSLHKIFVPIPINSIKEQEKIVAKLDLLSNLTKLLQEKYINKLANLEELKKSILEKAFKGELV